MEVRQRLLARRNTGDSGVDVRAHGVDNFGALVLVAGGLRDALDLGVDVVDACGCR